MSNETPQLYVINEGQLELTDEGRSVSTSEDHKYLESLLHQFCDEITVTYRDKAARTALSDEYNERDQQIRSDLGASRISLDSAIAQLNGLGPNPESPLYRTENNLGSDYLYLHQLDQLIRVLNASRDLVNRRMREINP